MSHSHCIQRVLEMAVLALAKRASSGFFLDECLLYNESKKKFRLSEGNS